jgi:hypothetical protein
MIKFQVLASQYYSKKSADVSLDDQSLTPDGTLDTELIAQRILSIPAKSPRQVLIKLDIMQNELAADMDLTAPISRKHIMMFAALQADIIELMASMDGGE